MFTARRGVKQLLQWKVACIFDFDTLFLKAKKLSCPSRVLNRNPSSSKRDLLLIGRVLCCPGDHGHVNAGTSVRVCWAGVRPRWCCWWRGPFAVGCSQMFPGLRWLGRVPCELREPDSLLSSTSCAFGWWGCSGFSCSAPSPCGARLLTPVRAQPEKARRVMTLGAASSYADGMISHVKSRPDCSGIVLLCVNGSIISVPLYPNFCGSLLDGVQRLSQVSLTVSHTVRWGFCRKMCRLRWAQIGEVSSLPTCCKLAVSLRHKESFWDAGKNFV